MTTILAPPPHRAYRDDVDWRALHQLAAETYRNTRRWRTWTPDRFDGFLRGRIYDEAIGKGERWRDDIRLWQAGGQLVAAVHPEGPEEAWLQVRDGWEHLLPDLLDWAQDHHLARHAADGQPPALQTYATADDAERQALLRQRGFVDRGPMEVLHGRCLAIPIAGARVPRGYRVRQADLADPDDRERFIAITKLVFSVTTFDDLAVALESRMLTQRAYFVAETEAGDFGAWCGVWSVPEIDAGQFEPVGTHPEHRRRGLASAVMARGLEWMRRHGLQMAFVGTGVRNASNLLYSSLDFEVAELYSQWEWLPALDAPG